jgi:hypothetical protein
MADAMTRRLSKHETACLDAMKNAPWATEALTVDLGVEVLLSKSMMMRADAEKIAQRLFDRYLKSYMGS